MATLPSASLLIDDQAGGFSGGTGAIAVFSCVSQNADLTPRFYSTAKGIIEQHGYSRGVNYAALHIKDTKKPVIFIGLPVDVAGVLGKVDNSGVLGTSQVSVSAGSSGYMEELDGVLTVVTGGTVGTIGIVFDLSLDGGRTSKRVRLGTATSYTVPRVGAVINFGAGTLVEEDSFSFSTTAPLWSQASLQAAREALAAQQKAVRTFLIAEDMPNSTYAGYVVSETNAYETADDRFVISRVSVKDQVTAKLSKTVKRMVGNPALTFLEVGVTGDTITRATGSWITDGFAVGDYVKVTGSASNNVTGEIASLSATVITLGSTDLANEGPVSGVSVSACSPLVFATAGDTITRTVGSWLNDGYAVGDSVTFAGTASNNLTGTISALTSTVMTVSVNLTDETLRSDAVTATKNQTRSAYVSATDTAFSSIDGEKRIDISLGRARKVSPILGAALRCPASWAASIREYQHDVHIPTWRKSDGPLSGWDLTDGQGRVVEYDERSDGGALAARFSCFRTWANGPNGPFLALSLTRQDESSLLSRTHNMHVTNVACTIVHAETENAIGQVLVLNDNGTGTEDSLKNIEERVNSKLQIGLLSDGPEGQRASKAVWAASRSDVLNVTGATLNGILELNLNGTIEQVATVVRIDTAG